MHDRATIVSCGGKQLISDAAEIREALLSALRQSADVVIDCSRTNDADLTFVQLLIASRRMARASGAELKIIAQPDSLIAEVLRRTGFAPGDLLADGAPTGV
ncbi:STAS domain-containing protein [Methylosinus sp. KRF6]|uniref:STAS domain-containing protein n=1 Tax=Methylosinus sp. KRF6 TaxID=2846853 RepID=UPI001C0DB7E8|nr:STAS domain-containing protein [Methylosinus sp. KRF6]MBU3888707.1 STAS domain-containing protein [Methylosinus sp. KRF6]